MKNQPIIDIAQIANPPKGKNVIAVASGKGGVGKTWLSISLAHALASSGQRALLFDGDLGLANVDIQLGLMPTKDLGEVMAQRIPLAHATTEYPAGGFTIIAGRSGTGSFGDLPMNRLTQLRNDILALARNYDYVVIDLGAGVDRTVRVLSRHAGTCLVVTTAEPTSLTDAYAFIKLTVADDLEADLRIVVNMSDTPREGQRTYDTLRKACEGFLKFSPPLAGIVRRDKRVPDAIRHQTSLMTRSPTSEAAQDIAAIAKKLIAPS
jgi:flagellar biosynthesis protein FlhG